MEDKENLIIETCKNLGINQQTLAKRLSFSITSVSKWKNGKSIPKYVVTTLELLSEYEALKNEYELFRKSILRK